MQVTVSFIDIAVIVVSTGLIIWWALKKGKSGDSKSYFLAGRSMSWIVVGLSLFAASISSTTLIGQTVRGEKRCVSKFGRSENI